MIQSMTGFGSRDFELNNQTLHIEIKSLNSKNFDLFLRVPPSFRSNESEIRSLISKHLHKGKIELTLRCVSKNGENSVQINQPVVKKYMSLLEEIAKGDPVSLLEIAMRLPESTSVEIDQIDDGDWIKTKEGIELVLQDLIAFRKQEGKTMEKDFNLRIDNIHTLLQQVDEKAPERIAHIKTKLIKSLEELKIEIDKNRFEQEMIYYLEKYDITEEIVRLKGHLSYFIETLKTLSPNGKKLGFISQEIGREINTIGSKSNYALMQKYCIQMKDELEKIKEQLLNVL